MDSLGDRKSKALDLAQRDQLGLTISAGQPRRREPCTRDPGLHKCQSFARASEHREIDLSEWLWLEFYIFTTCTYGIWQWLPRSSFWTLWLVLFQSSSSSDFFFLNIMSLSTFIPQFATATTTPYCLIFATLPLFAWTLCPLTSVWPCAERPHGLTLCNTLESSSPYSIQDDFLRSKKGKGPEWIIEGAYGIHSAENKYGTGEKVTVAPFAFGM